MKTDYAQRIAAWQGDMHSASLYNQFMEEPKDRLKAARIKAGYETAPAAAAALGIPDATYMAHENGSRGFTKSAERYARLFKTTPAALLFDAKEPATSPPHESTAAVGQLVDIQALRHLIRTVETAPRPGALGRPKAVERRIPIVGAVEAGTWRKAPIRELHDIEEWLALDVAGYERAQLRAWKVSGNSMNLVYPAGRYIVTAHPAEAGLRVGDYVVVERHTADLVEVTCKEFSVDDAGRMVLLPRSSAIEHQDPIYLRGGDELDQTGPVIVGVVVADYAQRVRPPLQFDRPTSWAE